MLEINNLSFAYGRGRKPVIDDFSLSLPQGGICGLLGPNGAGKSTLLYLIMGVLMPRSGSVTFDGTDTATRNPEALANMMLVPEEITLPGVSLENFKKLYGAMYPRFSAEIMDRCLAEFNVSDIRKLSGLSMGQKKKVYISFALACRPKLLLMDEPTNGLDIMGKASFRRLLATTIDDDTTVIISTHQVRDLEQVLERVLIMNERRVLFSSAVDEIQRRLKFVRNASPEEASGALTWIPSPGGTDVMTLNTDGAETFINLELLFDYALRESERLNAIFNQTTPSNSNGNL